jgi:hypothetical protein
MADEANNCWRRPYDPRADEGTLEHYLRWEIDLVHEIEREGTAASELTPLAHSLFTMLYETD